MSRVSASLLAASAFTALGISHVALAQCPVSYAAATPLVAGLATSHVAIGDFNRDGKLDMVVTNSSSNTVGVYMGNGNGTFAAAVTYPVGNGPTFVAVGDINYDGAPDLVVANFGSNSISVLMNSGTGSFAAAVNYGTLVGPKQVALGDMNGDGALDVAVANNGSAAVSTFFNLGAGVLSSRLDIATGSLSNGVGLADFTGDGVLDLAVSRGGSGGSGGVLICAGVGNGAFQPGMSTGGGGGGWVQLADMNGDGKQDIVVLNQGANAVYIQYGRGDGTFQPVVTVSSTNVGGAWGVGISDLNGDGILDLVIPQAGANALQVFTGRTSGTFSAPYSVPTISGPLAVALGDFNGDGAPDLAIPNYSAGRVSVALSTTPVIRFLSQPQSASVAAGGRVTMEVSVNGASYQWCRNGVPLVSGGLTFGINTPRLDIVDVTPAQAGYYTVVVTNGCAQGTSVPALLSVYNPCPGDFNGDGSIDFFDYLDFVSSFTAGC